ncbi:MAG: hypothetical protein ACR2FV_14920 [Ornithinimicrobium sp.]|uniref:hypothetical protein n=1 Tax=Ornithinimicrobium sp. TaxID=1977084 RepID=UPI003D9BB626
MAEQTRGGRGQGMSSIKEALAGWGDVAALLRGGDQGVLVPVVIPKDSRGLRWLSLVWLALWAGFSGIFLLLGGHGALGALALPVAVISVLLAPCGGGAPPSWRSRRAPSGC